MFPIKNFSDILSFMNTDQRFIETPFNTMILYKTEHSEFRKYIHDQFERIHHQTQNISCIIVDTPPIDWTKREDYQDYNEIVGNDYKPVLNDFEIEIICRYMDIEIKNLPCIVLYNDIKKHNFNCFSFSQVKMSIVNSFFDSLLEKTAMYTFQNMDFVDTMIQLRREFPQCKILIEWDKSNIIFDRLINAINDIKFYRSQENQSYQEKRPRKQTPMQIVRQCCQARAQQLWEKKPQMTIKAVIESENIRSCFDNSNIEEKKDRTLRDWVKEFCPNREPGRRPKT